MAINTNCADCKFCLDGMCSNPLLEYLLDDKQHEQNKSVECSPCRDFKFACGHEATWFVLRE